MHNFFISFMCCLDFFYICKVSVRNKVESMVLVVKFEIRVDVGSSSTINYYLKIMHSSVQID